LEYNAMLIGAFEAFTARREDLHAETALIEATRDYWTTRAELERAVGGDLNTPPKPASRPVVLTESKPIKPPRTRKP
jgi:outer membrane protein, heavy metal efflux system